MIKLDGISLTVEDVVRVAIHKEEVGLTESGKANILRSRKNLERLVSSGKTIYGINTGFGNLMDIRIHDEDLLKLQENLIRSHSSGVGEPLPVEEVRAMMLIRANSLIKGFSGVTIELIEVILSFLNTRITPVVPRYGSVGASGDLAPLAHIALCIMGESDVFYNGERMNTKKAMEITGIRPHTFREKEGVAFINGTSSISGLLALSVHDSRVILDASLAAASISLQALMGTDKAFTEWVIATRSHHGQSVVASSMRKLLSGYTGNASRIQDAYSLRCIPQVYGAVLDTIDYAEKVLTTEINSVTDNPILIEEEAVSAGNFHGEPVALVADFLAIAMTDLGNMMERRIFRLTSSFLSGLPPFLTMESGLNSGFMIPQYTAAALCNMNKVLSHPASSDTIPTSADQEDHVSMGMNGSLKLRDVIKNVRYIAAIEMLTACQGIDFSEAKISKTAKTLISMIRKHVTHAEIDRSHSPDIEKINALIQTEDFLSMLSKIMS
jgi:histidine ammonia-lyase